MEIVGPARLHAAVGEKSFLYPRARIPTWNYCAYALCYETHRNMGCVIILEWARNEAWMTKQERHKGFWRGNRQKNNMENQTQNAK